MSDQRARRSTTSTPRTAYDAVATAAAGVRGRAGLSRTPTSTVATSSRRPGTCCCSTDDDAGRHACGCSTTARARGSAASSSRPSARGRGLAARADGRRRWPRCGDREVRLDAQTGLTDFYAGYGFEVSGPEFDEDGVMHVPMVRQALVGHDAVDLAAGHVAAGDEEFEVRARLERGQGGIEDVEVLEQVLVPRPRQHARHVVRRLRPACDRRHAQLEPHLVVREELVDPGVRRRRDRAVGGQQREVGQPAHLGERGHEVTERLRRQRGLEADRRA